MDDGGFHTEKRQTVVFTMYDVIVNAEVEEGGHAPSFSHAQVGLNGA
jgi:hypothetical protein